MQPMRKPSSGAKAVGLPPTDDVDRRVSVERAAPNQKVLWLNIARDNVFGMNVFQSRDELDCTHANCLQAKPPPTHVEEVFQARPQKLEHKAVVFSATAKVIALGDANCKREEMAKF